MGSTMIADSEHAGRGGLAGAVRAEEAEDLSGADVEVELVHRGEIGALVDLGQVLGVDDGVRLAHRNSSLGPGPGRMIHLSFTRPASRRHMSLFS
jgi:hypothetical protein